MIILRDYQRDVVDKIYQAWQSGKKNVCAVLPTGAGKSVCVSEIVANSFNAGQRVAVIAHRNELVAQMACHIARRGIPHKIIASAGTIAQIMRKERDLFGKSFVNPSGSVAVIGVDTLMSRSDSLKEWAYQVNLWIVDECFPAGTLVTTKKGLVKIEDIKIGDDVVAFDEENRTFSIKKVIETFKNPIHNDMMLLTFKGHHVIKCTKNHPFYTKRGWVKASDLTLKDEVLYYEKHNSEMFDLRKRNYNHRKLQNKQIHKNRQNLLFARMCKSLQIKNIVRNNGSDESKICFTTDERTKSYEKTGSERKTFKNFASYESQTFLSRRKRKRITDGRKNSFRTFNRFGFYRTMCCQNRSLSRRGLSDLLQNRCWKSCVKNRYRSRRSFSRFFAKTKTGQEKRAVSNWFRLEDIKIYQPRDNGKYGKGYVYNIGVADLHTYIANGFVVHNCHHVVKSNKWGKAVEMFPNAYGLGVTATPARADGQGLSRETDGVADVMVLGPTSRQLIELGHLSDYEIVCPKSDLNVDDIKLSADGDWCSKNLKKAAKASKIVGDVVENYKKYAFGRKAIVFATDVETADDIALSFNDGGIKAASVNGTSKSSWREQCLSQFAAGTLPVLVNVDLFDEGFDCPDADVCVMARPTASLAKYLQMIGRVLRPVPNKTALVIDHVSNVIRHGLPDRYRTWSLNRREKRAKLQKDPEELDLKICPYCLKPFEAFRTSCPYCGQAKPLPEPRSRSIEMVDGDLVLLDKTTLERMRQSTVLETPEEIQARVSRSQGSIIGKHVAKCQAEKIEAQKELIDSLAQWAAIQRQDGFTDQELYRKFYLTTGSDVLTALSASHNRQEYTDMAETVKGWYEK